MTPGAKEEGTAKNDNEDKVDTYHSSKYRAIVGRLNCLTSDRPDIAFSVKELARSMSSPSKGCQ